MASTRAAVLFVAGFVVRFGAGYVIKPARMPRVAFTETFHGEQATAHTAVRRYRLPGIFRAGRVKTALVACPRA